MASMKISVSLSPDEYLAIKQAAAALGITPYAYVKQAAIDAANRRPEPDLHLADTNIQAIPVSAADPATASIAALARKVDALIASHGQVINVLRELA
jgi:hypothetical protein